jgi:thiol-disulfide isomerase/thioredoxin
MVLRTRVVTFCCCAALASAGIATDTQRTVVAKKDLAGAEKMVKEYRKAQPDTPEVAAAVSWLARGALFAKDYDKADAYAEEARKMALEMLKGHKLDDEKWLPTAVGASEEVHAQVLGARGENDQAVEFLKADLKMFANTSLPERINKNINLLSLEGKPAPALNADVWFGAKPPSLASLKGHPVVLFFWAHWCPDCKAEIGILAKVMQDYTPKGVALIGPTKYYGYMAHGQDATPEVEKPYIDQVRKQFYAPLGDMPAPLDNANFANYGASTVPTLVIIDKKGVVRLYHPGNLTEQELTAQLDSVLK